MTHAGHGINLGNGYTKVVIIDEHGVELAPVTFPSMVAPAGRHVAGAIRTVPVIEAGERLWWVGEDAQFAPSQITMLAQDRLTDPIYLPALLKGALARFGDLNGASAGVCVSGLPATWALDEEKRRALGARLRAATGDRYARIKVIPEPLGAIYNLMLDTNGDETGAAELQGTVAVVDIGHRTVDVAVMKELVPLPSSLLTFDLGTVEPLGAVRSLINTAYDTDLSLFETDMAIRAGQVKIGPSLRPLPRGWERPLVDNGHAIAARLAEAWKSGAKLNLILLSGGGSELAPMMEPIRERFPHAEVVPGGQLAIARGYARLARRVAKELVS